MTERPDRKDRRVNASFAEKHFEKLKSRAEDQGLSMSAYVRLAVIGKMKHR